MFVKNETPTSSRVFGEILHKVFNTRKVQKRVDKVVKVFYNGLSFRENQPNNDTLLMAAFDVLPHAHAKSSSDGITITIPTKYMMNGHEINKTVILRSDNTWTLSLGVKQIDISRLGFSSEYKPFMAQSLLNTIDKLTLCTGQLRPQHVTVGTNFAETWFLPGSENPKLSVRTQQCYGVLGFQSTTSCCRACQKLKLSTPHNKGEIVLDEADSSDMNRILDAVFPNAPSSFKVLLESQKMAHDGNDSRGIRWNRQLIQWCLTLYTRSPGTYQELSSNGFLRLLSGRLLSMYKNAIPQDTGLNASTILWMYNEAERIGLPAAGREGGIIIDEMAIQPDIQMVKCGSGFKLYGFATLGEEADIQKNLLKSNKDKVIANYVLQVHFLGFSGFRFPIAHFPSTQATATELNLIFWNAVELMQSFGFHISYTNMDGALTNRQFLKINFNGSSPSAEKYLALSPIVRSQRVAFIMDYSHVIKKIRNSLYNSGPNGTRSILSSRGLDIQWKAWVEAYDFDRSNPIQVHKKLTKDHIYLDTSSKMRNHLAEEVLNDDMLQLMVDYKGSLGSGGKCLDPHIELIKQTSTLIKVFRDARPISSMSDPRIQQLQDVLKWFTDWEAAIYRKHKQPAVRNKALISPEAREDLESCIVGFIQLLELRNSQHPGFSIIPGRLNSDVIENNFSQQRGLHNGANANPTYATYSKTMNSVVLGQSSISRKSNTGGRGAESFAFSSGKPLRKAPKQKSSVLVDSPKPSKRTKIIRL